MRDVERVKLAFLELMRLAPELNRLRDGLRTKANLIAGCELVNWSFEDIQRYVDLAIETSKAHASHS